MDQLITKERYLISRDLSLITFAKKFLPMKKNVFRDADDYVRL